MPPFGLKVIVTDFVVIVTEVVAVFVVPFCVYDAWIVTLRCVAVPFADRTPDELIDAYDDPLVIVHVGAIVPVVPSLRTTVHA